MDNDVFYNDSENIEAKKCLSCGKDIDTPIPMDYCHKCLDEIYPHYHFKECLLCKKIFFGEGRRKFCSKECRASANHKIIKKTICDVCGKEYNGYNLPNMEHICSNDCLINYNAKLKHQLLMKTFGTDNIKLIKKLIKESINETK